MLSIMSYAAAATTATCFALRPRGAQGQARSAQLRAGQRVRATAARSMGHLNWQLSFY